ncbi:YybH family protein [Fibrella aquatilis]|uniref:Nuclear transport factor 2 family protein n=1 Tax=Fibrella aquatilis TaxID=2817059 RepID=A0A939G8B1_9BACT|nr:nuclear transport factor 2 family protein [Fibrella aquatilis]MBO0932220.1 nuclear transport factor 2 family protein [Fibrella aquatilis]
MRHILLLLTCLAIAATASAQTPADRKAILGILKRQNDDWNAGRVEQFMVGYWPSDSLTFVGKGGITYGYAPTLANYKKRYPDRAAMGTLAFTILKTEFPGPNVAYVIGKWHLTRPQVGDVGGHFTLLWRKIAGQWVIISDHSS